MTFVISQKNRHILRELARKQFELSQLPQMQLLKKDWTNLNGCAGGRPIITVEVYTFQNDVIPSLMRCESNGFEG